MAANSFPGEVKVKGNKLIITIEMYEQPFPPSSSGKSLKVVSSGGNRQCGIELEEGRPLFVGVNAFFYPSEENR